MDAANHDRCSYNNSPCMPNQRTRQRNKLKEIYFQSPKAYGEGRIENYTFNSKPNCQCTSCALLCLLHIKEAFGFNVALACLQQNGDKEDTKRNLTWCLFKKGVPACNMAAHTKQKCCCRTTIGRNIFMALLPVMPNPSQISTIGSDDKDCCF